METLIQELQPSQLKDLDKALEKIPSGTEVELRFESLVALSQKDLDLFEQNLVAAGFKLTQPISVTDDMPTVTVVRFIKGPLVPPAPEGGGLSVGFAPLALALMSVIPTALITGLITVGVFKVETLTKSLIPFVAVAGAALFLIAVAQSKRSSK